MVMVSYILQLFIKLKVPLVENHDNGKLYHSIIYQAQSSCGKSMRKTKKSSKWACWESKQNSGSYQ